MATKFQKNCTLKCQSIYPSVGISISLKIMSILEYASSFLRHTVKKTKSSEQDPKWSGRNGLKHMGQPRLLVGLEDIFLKAITTTQYTSGKHSNEEGQLSTKVVLHQKCSCKTLSSECLGIEAVNGLEKIPGYRHNWQNTFFHFQTFITVIMKIENLNFLYIFHNTSGGYKLHMIWSNFQNSYFYSHNIFLCSYVHDYLPLVLFTFLVSF